MPQLKVTYNEKTDTMYFHLSDERVSYTQEFGEDVRLEYGEKGDIVGLNVRRAKENIVAGLKARGIDEIELVKRVPASPIKIEISRDLCLGFGSCVAVAPKVFQLDEMHDQERKGFFLSRAKIEVVDEDSEEREIIIRAAQACPTKAIILRDRKSEEQIYP